MQRWLAMYQCLNRSGTEVTMESLFAKPDRRHVLAGLAASGLVGTPLLAAPRGETLYDLARALYVYAFPLAYFARYRHAGVTQLDRLVGKRLTVNAWAHADQVVTPESFGAPQTDTLYSLLIADLSREPLVVSIPQMDGRYWGLQCCDFLGTTFAIINRRNTAKATRAMLVGPDWQGGLPVGVDTLYRSPTRWAFNLMRVHFTSEADRAVMIRLRSQFAANPWSVHRGARASAEPSRPLVAPTDRGTDPLADFRLIAALWAECPPPAADKAVLTRFAPLGFGPGARPVIDRASPEVRAALTRAEGDGFAEIMTLIRSSNPPQTVNGWNKPNAQLGTYSDGNYLLRAAVAEAGIIGTPPSENVYLHMHKLANGERLSGDAKYELIFDAASLTQAGAFWSLHAYRFPNLSVIANPLGRYGISSRSEGLRHNADGSLTLYLQPNDPGGDRTPNWLPIILPGEPFMLSTRAYEPSGAIAALTWPGPRVVKIV